MAAKCRASSAVGFMARCLCEGGSLKGGNVVTSWVFGFFDLSMTIDEYPSSILYYGHNFH